MSSPNKIKLLSVGQIITFNKYICEQQKNPFAILDQGKIESALHTAFYPGSYPFIAGGIAKVAGALCFYLLKAHAFLDGNKRTASLAAVVFMTASGYKLIYPQKEENGWSALANIVDGCAANRVNKDELIEWFDRHKNPTSS